MNTYIVIDTGYFVELFKIPKRSSEQDSKEIIKRFGIAGKQNYRLYIPIPVLVELGNHIAHVDNKETRRNLAIQFSELVKKGIDKNKPQISITAFPIEQEISINSEELTFANKLGDFIESFVAEFSQKGLGFTDAVVLLEARKLHAKYKKFGKVHIWTTDRDLKHQEPDTEPDYFIGTRK